MRGSIPAVTLADLDAAAAPHSGSWMTPPVVLEVSRRAYREVSRAIHAVGASGTRMRRHDDILEISHTYVDEHGGRRTHRSIWLIDMGDGFFLMERDPGARVEPP